MPHIDILADHGGEAGIFTWCLHTDLLYADTTIANLFGIAPSLTIGGLPVTQYLDRVHPEDRATVARLISEAITQGRPYRAEYRVTDAYGMQRDVIAHGRCFRDKTGVPLHYAGIIHPVQEPARC
jgi:PAS domain-containing protein